jgi:hypothetical protein
VYSVLPIELVSFSAAWSGKAPLLVWTTASEKNNAYFEVERSFNGKSFETVGHLVGAGTTTARTNYQFTDVTLSHTAAAIVYYRLRQVDVDGTATYSPVRTVKVPLTPQGLQATVFPNPYEKTVAVQFNSSEAGSTMLIVQDALGKLVFAKTVNTSAGLQEISLPEAAALPAGVYYLTVQQAGGKQVMKMSHQ